MAPQHVWELQRPPAAIGPMAAAPAVHLIAGLGFFGAALQVVPSIEPGFVDQIGRLGMVGLLALAVVVLWKKLQEKDTILMANYKAMAEALATNKAVVEKMADTLVRIEAAVDRLDNVRTIVRPHSSQQQYGVE